MFGKIFDSIFDSTLVAEGGFIPTYIFMSMVVLADEDGFVDLSFDALYNRLGFPNDFLIKQEFIGAINLLEAPDENSNLNEMEGKRIVPLTEFDEIPENRGWFIVNYLHYRNKGNRKEQKEARREYMRQYMIKRREEEKNINKNNDGNTCKQSLTLVSEKPPYTDVYTDINKIKRVVEKFIPPTPKEVKQYIEGKKLVIDADDFCDFYNSKGWMVGKNKMKNWKSAASRWARKNNEEERKNGNGKKSAAEYLRKQMQEIHGKDGNIILDA